MMDPIVGETPHLACAVGPAQSVALRQNILSTVPKMHNGWSLNEKRSSSRLLLKTRQTSQNIEVRSRQANNLLHGNKMLCATFPLVRFWGSRECHSSNFLSALNANHLTLLASTVNLTCCYRL